jgi:hypothetical protein
MRITYSLPGCSLDSSNRLVTLSDYLSGFLLETGGLDAPCTPVYVSLSNWETAPTPSGLF